MAFRLPTHLYRRCRATFLKCSQFESHTTLRAVFTAGDLSTYRNGLPEADNKEDRVDSVLDYLLEQAFRESQPVIVEFIEMLCIKYQPDHPIYAELQTLHNDIGQEFDGAVEIPFVVAAMTAEESQALFSESVFNHPAVAPEERIKFQAFKQALLTHVPAECADRYGSERDAWCPVLDQQKTIRQIIWDAFTDVNEQQQRTTSSPQIFRPKFHSATFFSDDASTRQKTWDHLSGSGCVLIVDAISLFHPWLAKKLDKSYVSSSDNVALLVISPINANEIPVNKIIEQEFSTRLERAFMRFTTHLDTLCEFGVGDIRSLRRWIFSTLPETAQIVQKQKSRPINKDRMRQIMGEPQGIDQLLFGHGELK
jgi:hypothetical protein